MSQETKKTLRVVAGLVFAAFFVLAARLWQLQILRGAEYSRLAQENRLRIEKVPSPRGIIYDRNGYPLVKNAPYFYVSVLRDKADEVDVSAVADLLSMPASEIAQALKAGSNTLEPIKIKGGLSFDEVAYIEARLTDYPSLVIEAEQTRHYPYGDIGAHVIGYLGRITPEQLSNSQFKDVPRQAFIGRWGIEKQFDVELRGEPGKRFFEVDALGRKQKLLREEAPVQGQDIYLSIDLDLQRAAEEAFGDRLGALVAINPSSGEVLAMVSRPSFDPNLFSRGIEYDKWRLLAEDKRFPMLNRSLQSQYPPGSTFKIISAIAALEEGAIEPSREYFCPGSISRGRWTFKCWKRAGHGVKDLHGAIVESCDVYFYNTGEELGIDPIARYARMMGLGAISGLNLVPEKSGLVPDTAWKKKEKKEPWYLGETFNSAIGQGFVLTTPTQLARMAATVASRGKKYPLSLMKAEGEVQPQEVLPISDKTLDVVISSLEDVVGGAHGTGGSARVKGIRVAGKTGTAQVISQREIDPSEMNSLPHNLRDHAWFVAFAPVEAPEIALAVFVEHGGHGGEAAAPIARKAIAAYLNKQKGGGG